MLHYGGGERQREENYDFFVFMQLMRNEIVNYHVENDTSINNFKINKKLSCFTCLTKTYDVLIKL
jgi:uncharacterized UBP type Zn finger protein